MADATSPDSIVKWTLNDPVSLTQESQAQGDSIQAAFNKRQRYDFVWANDAARTAQTGMVEGSRGYQIDTRIEWVYLSSAWKVWDAINQSFTPAWSNFSPGAGATVNARYAITGRFAQVFVSLTLASGFSMGDAHLTFPTGAAPAPWLFTMNAAQKIGWSNFEDVSAGAAGRFEGTALFASSWNGARVGAITGSPSGFLNLSTTTPFTWVAGDRIHVFLSYPIE